MARDAVDLRDESRSYHEGRRPRCLAAYTVRRETDRSVKATSLYRVDIAEAAIAGPARHVQAERSGVTGFIDWFDMGSRQPSKGEAYLAETPRGVPRGRKKE